MLLLHGPWDGWAEAKRLPKQQQQTLLLLRLYYYYYYCYYCVLYFNLIDYMYILRDWCI